MHDGGGAGDNTERVGGDQAAKDWKAFLKGFYF